MANPTNQNDNSESDGAQNGLTPEEFSAGDDPAKPETETDDSGADGVSAESDGPETADAEARSDEDAPDEDAIPEAETPEPDAAEESAEDAPDGHDPALADALATATLLSDGAATADADGTDGGHDIHEDDLHEAHEDEEHEEHEEHGRPLAARVLTGLVLLIVGAGLALWGAPRIAPNLPSGLAPVKAWLLPGEAVSQQRIATLEASLDQRFAAIPPPGISSDEAAAIGGAGIADLEARLADRITALADQVAAADSAEVESRLAQLETRIEGLMSQVDTLGVLAGDDSLSEEAVAELGAFAAAIEGLRGGIDELADQQGALSQRIDEVEAAVARRIAEAEEEVAAVTEEAEQAETALIARAALEALDAALASGEPFEGPLATIAASGTEVPVALSGPAAAGVATLGALRSAFPDAAHEAIRAGIRARAGTGVGGRLASYLESQVASRSLTPQDGDSTDAVLSRAEDALRRDNLAAAVAELEGLGEAPREAMQGWLARAEARVAALGAYSELRAALAAEN